MIEGCHTISVFCFLFLLFTSCDYKVAMSSSFFHFLFFYWSNFWFCKTILMLVRLFEDWLIIIWNKMSNFWHWRTDWLTDWLTDKHEIIPATLSYELSTSCSNLQRLRTRVHWPTAGVHRLSLWWLALRAVSSLRVVFRVEECSVTSRLL